MKELITKVEKILDTYFKDNVGNRENQWSFRTLKQVVLGEIANYQVNKKANVEAKPLIPIKKKANVGQTEKKIIRK